MKVWGWLLVLCGFVAGVLVGIEVNRSTHKPEALAPARLATPDYTYVVEDYQMANLQVPSGKTIALVGPDGNADNYVMNFVGNSPCLDHGTHKNKVNPCTLDIKLTDQSYFFTCDQIDPSTGKTTASDLCPDPGIQPSPTGPIEDATRKDSGPARAPYAPVQTGEPPKMRLASTTDAHVRLVASCSDGTNTVLKDQHGNLGTPSYTVGKGQTVYWLSSHPYKLAPTPYTNGLCAGGPPKVTSDYEAQCAVNTTGLTMTYNVTATNPATGKDCSVLSAALTSQ